MTPNTYNALRNPRFYLESFLKIRSLNKQIIPLHLNYPQRVAHRFAERMRRKHGYIRIRNLKARKLGLSTYWDGRIFHNTATIPNTSSAIISHDSESARALLDICKIFYEELPSQIRPMRRYYSKKALVFENPSNELRLSDPGLRSSIIITPAKSAKFGRAPVFHNLHLSEEAYYPSNSEELLTGILSAVPDNKNTIIVEETTANGAQGLFYDRWNSKDSFRRLFLPWFILPRYRIKGARIHRSTLDKEELALIESFALSGEQLEWRRRTIKNKCNNRPEIFRQEYPSTPKEAFIYSGSNIFPGSVLKWYEDNTIQSPILRALHYKSQARDESILISRNLKPFPSEDFDDNKQLINFFSFPKPDLSYFIGVDSAEGLRTGDSSAIVVLSSTGEECASYCNHLDPISTAILAAKLGLYYNTAQIIPESNNHGGTTVTKLIELGYPDLYRRESHDSLSHSVSKRIGWFNNDVTKAIAINFLRSALEEFVLTIRSHSVLTQLEAFVKKPNGQLRGDHDDLVIALSLATYASRDCLTPIFERKKLHQILNINEEKAESLQKALHGDYQFSPGTLGYTDSILKQIEDDEDIPLPQHDNFVNQYLDHYYDRSFPFTFGDLPYGL